MDVLSCVGADPGGKPFETFGKDSGYKLRRREHGTTDRLALPHQHRQKGEIAETVRSAPGRGSTDGAGYTDFGRYGKGKRPPNQPHLGAKSPLGLTRPYPAVSFGLNLRDWKVQGAPMTAAFTFPGQ